MSRFTGPTIRLLKRLFSLSKKGKITLAATLSLVLVAGLEIAFPKSDFLFYDNIINNNIARTETRAAGTNCIVTKGGKLPEVECNKINPDLLELKAGVTV